MSEERARELNIEGYYAGRECSPVGSLHPFKCNGHTPEDCACGINDTADNR